MSNQQFNIIEKSQEPPNQIQGNFPLFNLPTFSGSQNDGHDSKQLNSSQSQQPASTYELSRLYNALEGPLKILSQTQDTLVSQYRSFSNMISDIQLNQNSSLMNMGMGTVLSKPFILQ
jgi:hypothetical protein